MDAPFAALAAGRIAPGGVWRLATDWQDYARQMAAVLDAEPSLSGGVVPRWEDRALRFGWPLAVRWARRALGVTPGIEVDDEAAVWREFDFVAEVTC